MSFQNQVKLYMYNEYIVKTNQFTVVLKRKCVTEQGRCTVQNLMI